MTISEKIVREQKRLDKAISLLKFATADVVYTTNRIEELSANDGYSFRGQYYKENS